MANKNKSLITRNNLFVAANKNTWLSFGTQLQLLKTLRFPSQFPLVVFIENVRVNAFRNSIGAHSPSITLVNMFATPSIDMVWQWFPTIRSWGKEVFAKGTLRKSLLPPRWSLANGINIDYANIFWEHIIIKLNKRHREKVVPYTRFLSLLMMHKIKEGYGDGEITLYPTQVFSVSNWALKPNQPKEPLFIDHMLAIYSATEPMVLKAPKPSSNAGRVS
ncbi:hypothetical protein Tco_0324190 [Tanacetum coccineum]